jgi:hypothetical protein
MPSGHGHAVSLAQLQVRIPAEFGRLQTQNPTLDAPAASRYWPAGRPIVLLQTAQAGTSQSWDAWGVKFEGQTGFAPPIV